MRTITFRIATTCISLLLVLEAVEAKSYFSPKSLAFQPRSRNCLVAQDCPIPFLALEVLRGGASKKTTEEETDDETDDEDEDSDIESDMEEEEEEDEVEEDEYDADEYDDEYDEESEEEEEEASVTVADLGEIVEPYYVPAQLQLYVMFGSMMITRKLDMFNPGVVKVIRFLFITQMIAQQLFIIYVRIMAKKNNDRTPIEQQSPISEMLKKQMDAGGNDMVKNLASSFLSSSSTVMEYDMKQASNMQGGVIFNAAFNWILHYKMQKTQPLLMQLLTGTMQLLYHPLFQVYVLGRNLERPFKTQISAAQKMEANEKGEADEDEAEKDDDDEEEEEEEEEEDEEEEAEDDDDDADDQEDDDDSDDSEEDS
ncbi:MAG: hypothetical protein SGBAC_002358 [Bacillariaceae sp.]